MSDEEAKKILDEARTFYIVRRDNNQRVTWDEYEYFKRRLHGIGSFGYEYRLAEILHI